MAWYWWLIIGWALCGAIAFCLEFRTNQSMRENIGANEVWPMALGPFWLIHKVGQLFTGSDSR